MSGQEGAYRERPYEDWTSGKEGSNRERPYEDWGHSGSKSDPSHKSLIDSVSDVINKGVSDATR